MRKAIDHFKVLRWKLPGRKPSNIRARVLAQIRTRQELKPLRTPLRHIVEAPFILNFKTRWRRVVNLALQLPYPRQRTQIVIK